MARFYSLFSGSKGNVSLVQAGSSALLIDAGVSCKRILTALSQHEIDAGSVEGILITHNHVDHISGVRVLCKKLGLKVYATDGTLRSLLHDGHITEEQVGMDLPPYEYALGSFGVTAFPTEHDAAGSCGFRISTADDRTCAICTDLGVVTETVHNTVAGCDMVLLESNFDPDMLRCGPYPAYLKRRISGTQGHLSNRDCAAEADRLIESGTTRLVLGHLSQENNTPQLAETAVREQLDRKYTAGRDYLMYTAGQNGLKEMVIF